MMRGSCFVVLFAWAWDTDPNKKSSTWMMGPVHAS